MERRKRINKVLFGFLVVAAIVCIVALSQVVKNRGGLNIKSTEEYPVSQGVVLYRQDDPAWADKNLGTSKYTMESSGCITSCIASAISESSQPMDPGQLLTLLTEKRVYDGAGNMQWGMLDAIDGFGVEVYNTLDKAFIDECLSQGRYPIVKVHRKSLFSYHHFVLIVGSENGEYICIDPLKDGYTTLSDYSNRIYSIRCVWHE
ncbi:hypothetical protein [Butyrivibrio sp. VCB2006]|uniref:hypothetical protein n=1 Tax=Butyrivibrio sp. VCB2006 TaxID=1280679 RepID=UPI000412B434|nr:hypothetical protein [Butyrivibrio sp. VCB2006]